MLNATFNNISVISWQQVLLVEETGGPGENHWPVASHWQIYRIMLYTSSWSRFNLTTSVVIGTNWIGSCKSNYHTITESMAQVQYWYLVYHEYRKDIIFLPFARDFFNQIHFTFALYNGIHMHHSHMNYLKKLFSNNFIFHSYILYSFWILWLIFVHETSIFSSTCIIAFFHIWTLFWGTSFIYHLSIKTMKGSQFFS